MIHVKIPATTANMGPGFDCIGMAFELYNHIWVEEWDGGDCLVECKGDDADDVPRTVDNMIYQTMKRFYDELGLGHMPGMRLVQENNIPMTRGLGSSAACIVGGLAAANELSGASISRDDLAFLASKIEGHPDNAAPALLGGVIVGVLTENKLEYIKIENDFIKNMRYAVMIPGFQLKTDMARGILPGRYSVEDGVFNTSRAALLAAALMSADPSKLMTAMDDRFHQPYRQPYIEGMVDVFRESREQGALGVFLSGAGPTIIALAEDDAFAGRMTTFLDTLQGQWTLKLLKPDFEGVVVNIK